MSRPNLKIAGEPPPRSPEREALAEAIARHSEAVDRQAAIETAQQHAQESIYAARDAVKASAAAIETAKVNAGQYLTDVALGTAGEAPLSVKDARAVAQDAEDALEAAQAALAALEQQHKDAEHELQWAGMALDEKLRAVVSAEANVKRLLAEAQAAQVEVVNKRIALRHLFNNSLVAETEMAAVRSFLLFENQLPAGRGQLERGNFDSHPAADPYKRAIEALRTDADAPLPTS